MARSGKVGSGGARPVKAGMAWLVGTGEVRLGKVGSGTTVVRQERRVRSGGAWLSADIGKLEGGLQEIKTWRPLTRTRK